MIKREELEVGDLIRITKPHLSLPADGRVMRVVDCRKDGKIFNAKYLSAREGASWGPGQKLNVYYADSEKL